MPHDEHRVLVATTHHLFGDAGFLGTGHEVVDEHPESSPGLRPELVHDRREIVDASEIFDDHPDVAEVIAPDLLDKLGVMTTLDEDSTRQRHLGLLRLLRRPRTRGRVLRARAARSHGRFQRDGFPFEQETWPEGEPSALALAILEKDDPVLPADDGPHEVIELHHHAQFDWGVLRLLQVCLLPAWRQHVVGVAIHARKRTTSARASCSPTPLPSTGALPKRRTTG